MAAPLVHLTTAAPWRAALSVGSLVAPSLLTDGFVHLSSPEQVALPANRLFAGRDDLLLLVVDPDRLTAEIRWERGVATDPASMRFPHLHGPLPTAAVTSVLPYRPGPGGAYVEPVDLPLPADLAARAMAFDRSLAERRAAVVLPVAGGVATVDPRVAHSWEHNSLWVRGQIDAATLAAEADRVLGALAGLRHRRAVLDRPPPSGLGWDQVEELRLLVLDGAAPVAGPPGIEVVAVTTETMAGLWRPSWFRDLDRATDEVVDDLIRREPLADAHVRVVDLAVLSDSGLPVAAAQLRLDGATAAIEAVMTDPSHRGRGLAGAVVAAAVARARAAGCDCIFLLAAADDWPRRWYERLGFVEVGERWEATKASTRPKGAIA